MKLKHHIVPAAASVFPASFATLPAASVKFATIENYWDFEGGMRIRISLFVYSVLFVLGLGVSPALAGGIPIPIIWGDGEKIVHRGELPAGVRYEISKELGASVSVGFIYSRFHVFYADLWTSNGRFVLYSDDQYWELKDVSEWREILGKAPQERFEKPFFYWFPLGWLILGPPLVLWGAFWMFAQLRDKRMARLFGDSRFTEAIKVLFEDTEETGLGTNCDQASFRAAVQGLEAKGIPRSKAEANLREMSQIVAAQRNRRIEHTLVMASSAMEGGDLQRARNLLEKLLDALPKSDPWHAPATEFLASLMEDGGTEVSPEAQSAGVSEEDDRSSPTIRNCSTCGARVLPKADGTCPRCKGKV